MVVRMTLTDTLGPLELECFGITDLKVGAGGVELYEAEAPPAEDCAVLDRVRLGDEVGGT